MTRLDPRCWCGHTRSSHVSTADSAMGCTSCTELGENHPHYFKLDPRQGKNVLDAVAEEAAPVDPTDFTHDFKVAPPRPELHVMAQSGDEFRIFVVTSGSYSDYAIRQIFVGNREAAYTWAAEYNRHHPGVHNEATVEEYTDESVGAPARREYPEPYTKVRVTTHVHMGTGKVLHTDTLESIEYRPCHVQTTITDGGYAQVGRDTAKTACIVTRGPDSEHVRILKSHSEHVARIRQAAIEGHPVTEVNR